MYLQVLSKNESHLLREDDFKTYVLLTGLICSSTSLNSHGVIIVQVGGCPRSVYNTLPRWFSPAKKAYKTFSFPSSETNKSSLNYTCSRIILRRSTAFRNYRFLQTQETSTFLYFIQESRKTFSSRQCFLRKCENISTWSSFWYFTKDLSILTLLSPLYLLLYLLSYFLLKLKSFLILLPLIKL